MTRGAFRRALNSVSDKASVIPLAELLARSGCEVIASGGTAKTLNEAGIKVTEIQSLTGLPEILGGRVESLQPSIHTAILANLDDQSHQEELASLGITPIDLVIGLRNISRL